MATKKTQTHGRVGSAYEGTNTPVLSDPAAGRPTDAPRLRAPRLDLSGLSRALGSANASVASSNKAKGEANDNMFLREFMDVYQTLETAEDAATTSDSVAYLEKNYLPTLSENEQKQVRDELRKVQEHKARESQGQISNETLLRTMNIRLKGMLDSNPGLNAVPILDAFSQVVGLNSHKEVRGIRGETDKKFNDEQAERRIKYLDAAEKAGIMEYNTIIDSSGQEIKVPNEWKTFKKGQETAEKFSMLMGDTSVLPEMTPEEATRMQIAAPERYKQIGEQARLEVNKAIHYLNENYGLSQIKNLLNQGKVLEAVDIKDQAIRQFNEAKNRQLAKYPYASAYVSSFDEMIKQYEQAFKDPTRIDYGIQQMEAQNKLMGLDIANKSPTLRVIAAMGNVVPKEMLTYVTNTLIPSSVTEVNSATKDLEAFSEIISTTLVNSSNNGSQVLREYAGEDRDAYRRVFTNMSADEQRGVLSEELKMINVLSGRSYQEGGKPLEPIAAAAVDSMGRTRSFNEASTEVFYGKALPATLPPALMRSVKEWSNEGYKNLEEAVSSAIENRLMTVVKRTRQGAQADGDVFGNSMEFVWDEKSGSIQPLREGRGMLSSMIRNTLPEGVDPSGSPMINYLENAQGTDNEAVKEVREASNFLFQLGKARGLPDKQAREVSMTLMNKMLGTISSTAAIYDEQTLAERRQAEEQARAKTEEDVDIEAK